METGDLAETQVGFWRWRRELPPTTQFLYKKTSFTPHQIIFFPASHSHHAFPHKWPLARHQQQEWDKIIFLRVHRIPWEMDTGSGIWENPLNTKVHFFLQEESNQGIGTNFPSLSIFRALSGKRGGCVGWGREMKISPFLSIPCRKARPGRTGNSEMGGKERECVCVGTSLNFNERKEERGEGKALRPRKGGTNGLH